MKNSGSANSISRSALLLLAAAAAAILASMQPAAAIRFAHRALDFTLENAESPGPLRYTPATMAGGVAVFDFDNDGDLDVYCTNGAEFPSLRKTSAKFSNRLLANDGAGGFTDVTARSGLAGTGYDTGVATADYDNDGDKDIFVAGVHRNSLYRNDGTGVFTEVTSAAGLGAVDPKYGPLWSVAGAWFDFDNDGWLDLFVVNYLSWDVSKEKPCPGYCHPKYYEGLPNRLYRNNRDGTFTDVSEPTGIRGHVGKGMGAAVADIDADGWLDVFVTNDKLSNFLFRNIGGRRFEEIALQAGVALPEHAVEISGMGADARDIDDDGLPDIVLVALDRETFPLYINAGNGRFVEATNRTGLAALSRGMGGYAPGIFDFDNDGLKDIFVSRGHVQSLDMAKNWTIEQHNTVFRNTGDGRFAALTAEAGFTGHPPRRHRGAAFGDVNADGRLDVVVTALAAPAQLWMNESPAKNHWLEIRLQGVRSNRDAIGARVKVVTKGGTQYNHVTSSTGYASSSAGPVHFGLRDASVADAIEIRWPSGAIQRLKAVPADQVLHVTEARPVRPAPLPSKPARPSRSSVR